MISFSKLIEEYPVIEKYSKSAPVDIESIIKGEGIILKEEFLGSEISGAISRIDEHTFQISVAQFEHPYRQRFTMAHEFAHYICHQDYIKVGEVGLRDTTSYTTGVLTALQEVEANQIAADILMPMHLVQDEIEKMTHVTIEKLSHIFEVSEIAMRIRLGIAG